MKHVDLFYFRTVSGVYEKGVFQRCMVIRPCPFENGIFNAKCYIYLNELIHIISCSSAKITARYVAHMMCSLLQLFRFTEFRDTTDDIQGYHNLVTTVASAQCACMHSGPSCCSCLIQSISSIYMYCCCQQ